MEQTDGQNYGTAFTTRDTCHATFEFVQNNEPEETAVLMWPSELDVAYLCSQMTSSGCQNYTAPMITVSYDQLPLKPISVIFWS